MFKKPFQLPLNKYEYIRNTSEGLEVADKIVAYLFR